MAGPSQNAIIKRWYKVPICDGRLTGRRQPKVGLSSAYDLGLAVCFEVQAIF